MEKLGRFGTLEQILKWIRWFEASISAILDRRRDSRTDKIAEMVRDYVMTHYKERITLGQTAEALGISQGYLSTAFKKQTGESFTGFVSAVKIEKAKELIAGHQYMMLRFPICWALIRLFISVRYLKRSPVFLRRNMKQNVSKPAMRCKREKV